MRKKRLEGSKPRILDFIGEYRKENGFSPSYRDIAEGVYLSLGTVITYMRELENDGYVTHVQGVCRSFQLTGKAYG